MCLCTYIVSCLVCFTGPSTVTVNIMKNIESLSIVVQWDVVDDSLTTTYTVLWTSERDHNLQSVALKEQTSYTITGLTLDTVYTITVTAVNRCGTGPEFTTSISFPADTTSTTSSISPTVTTITNPMTIMSTANSVTITTSTSVLTTTTAMVYPSATTNKLITTTVSRNITTTANTVNITSHGATVTTTTLMESSVIISTTTTTAVTNIICM